MDLGILFITKNIPILTENIIFVADNLIWPIQQTLNNDGLSNCNKIKLYNKFKRY